MASLGLAENGMGRCRYGANALWTLHGDVSGSYARRFAQRVDLFFRAESANLLVDLRGAEMIDSVGASALAGLRGRHAGFSVVGRPSSWVDLPPVVREVLRGLRPSPDLETALAAVSPRPSAEYREKRRHPRIPLQLPVEVYCAGSIAPASVRELSRGGLRLALLPEGWLGGLRKTANTTTLSIFGLEADPLGREIAAGSDAGPVTAIPVSALPGGILGARFAEAHPPV